MAEINKKTAFKSKTEKTFTVEQARAYSKSAIRKSAGTGVRIVYKTTTSNSSFPPKITKLNKLLSKAKLTK
ncbi:MAG TPA: hypothetical protein VIM07_14725 [Chitinophagaceae bacterium]